MWWGPTSQPSLRGDRKIGNQKGLVQPIEPATEPSWVARDLLSSLRDQFVFFSVSRSSFEHFCSRSAFPCSKTTSVWKSGISWCPRRNKVTANSGWVRAVSRLALSITVLSDMGALVCQSVTYCQKGTDAALPINSRGPSLPCDTAHVSVWCINLGVTLARLAEVSRIPCAVTAPLRSCYKILPRLG